MVQIIGGKLEFSSLKWHLTYVLSSISEMSRYKTSSAHPRAPSQIKVDLKAIQTFLDKSGSLEEANDLNYLENFFQ